MKFCKGTASNSLYLTNILIASIFLAICLPSEVQAQFAGSVYYVSPDGDDDAPGTRQEPWATPNHAGEAARAGDEVIFLPGTYSGRLVPQRSGSPQRPIVFRADERRTVVFEGEGDDSYPIQIEQLRHIRVEGFHIEPAGQDGRWLYIWDSEHITLADCLFEKAYGGTPFQIAESRNIRVVDSVLRKNAFNMARVSDSEQIIFEGNAISRAGHSPLQFFPPDTNSELVARGNVFHAAWGRAVEFFPSEEALFENNIVTNSYNGSRSASSNSKFAVQGGIFRFNRVYRNRGGALHLYAWRESPMEDIELYHNIFHDNAHYGLRVGGSRASNINFTNNIFKDNDPHGSWTQLRVDRGSPEAMGFRANVFEGSGGNADHNINWSGDRRDIASVQTPDFIERFGEVFTENKNVAAGFENAGQYHHTLRDDSPLISAGEPLSRTRNGGSGSTLPVTNPSVFYDGFGISGEQGDLIAVGEDQQVARVTSVDREAAEIELDRSVSWQSDEPVSFPWSGPSPDIGAYEHQEGRPFLKVRTTPHKAETGEQINMELIHRGISEINSIEWRLGDGTLVEGQTSITHEYTDAFDYPIRVRAEDINGNIHRAVGFVDVVEPSSSSDPLLSSTFGTEDEEWWWRWQTYRPDPVRWERILVLEDGEDPPPPWSNPRGGNRLVPPEGELTSGWGWLRLYAPDDNYHLAARLYPEEWDINSYPILRIRYRLEPDTPVGIYINAFPVPENNDREVWLAASPASARATENSDLPQLIDDGQWHEIELDTRAVREEYPDVNVLQGLHFWSEDIGEIEEGHALELDEVHILPEMD